MNSTLIIDLEKREARLIVSTADKLITSAQSNYHGLRKWIPLTIALSREFGTYTVLGEDIQDYSFKTFEYSNGVWVHTEPYEYLIDVCRDQIKTEEEKKKADELYKKVKELVKSVGYEVQDFNDEYKRFNICPPYGLQ